MFTKKCESFDACMFVTIIQDQDSAVVWKNARLLFVPKECTYASPVPWDRFNSNRFSKRKEKEAFAQKWNIYLLIKKKNSRTF